MDTGNLTDFAKFPVDPLDLMTAAADADYRRRAILSVIESYNSNYDVLAELLQNAVDAVEDADEAGLLAPFRIDITINLKENSLTVLDTGVGMSADQICRVFAPHITYKGPTSNANSRRQPYRGYKGVGLTYLAYGTDEIAIHSRVQDGALVKGRMKYGRSWAEGKRVDSSKIVADDRGSPLDALVRGSFFELHFSPATRPRSLVHMASTVKEWATIIRTRTAIGQVLLGRTATTPIEVRLTVITSDGASPKETIEPVFYYPHTVQRTPPLRFLDLPGYHRNTPEATNIPREKQRQDGLFLEWDTERIRQALTDEERNEFNAELTLYQPSLYAFQPYSSSIWGELNEITTGDKRSRRSFSPGLMIAVNGQRLADLFEFETTRYTYLAFDTFVVVHFDNAKPDMGRKTLQTEVVNLAKAAAGRVVLYVADNKNFLRDPGEPPGADARETENSHADWIYNVRKHAESAPLHIPPVNYQSEPLTEQDVVGLFNQLAARGLFAGIQIFATSQNMTYDCLVRFDCDRTARGIRYSPADEHPLGLTPYTLGDLSRFQTKHLTLEFKNNLDKLIAEVSDQNSPKSFRQIDLCVCWSTVQPKFRGFELTELTEPRLDERKFPGVTHVLHKENEGHSIQVVMLKDVVDLIKSGRISVA